MAVGGTAKSWAFRGSHKRVTQETVPCAERRAGSSDPAAVPEAFWGGGSADGVLWVSGSRQRLEGTWGPLGAGHPRGNRAPQPPGLCTGQASSSRQGPPQV